MRFQNASMIWLSIVFVIHFATNVESVLGFQVAADDQKSHAKVYPLQFTTAKEVHSTIENLVNENYSDLLAPVSIVPDSRSNSLIVVAGIDGQRVVKELIQLVDVETREPVKEKPTRKVQMIPFKGLRPNLVNDVLQSTLAGRNGVRMEVVEELGIVILYGSQEDVDKVESVLDTMKNSIGQAKKESNVYISMTFIVDGEQINEDELKKFSPPNSQIQPVIAKSVAAGLISIKKPVVVSKTVNRVRVNHDMPITAQKETGLGPAFVNRSESDGKRYTMTNSGYISQLSANSFHVDADIQLSVNSQMAMLTANSTIADQVQGSTELNTTMEVPLNHPVLLSFSTILGVDSVVILQVHEAK